MWAGCRPRAFLLDRIRASFDALEQQLESMLILLFCSSLVHLFHGFCRLKTASSVVCSSGGVTQNILNLLCLLGVHLLSLMSWPWPWRSVFVVTLNLKDKVDKCLASRKVVGVQTCSNQWSPLRAENHCFCKLGPIGKRWQKTISLTMLHLALCCVRMRAHEQEVGHTCGPHGPYGPRDGNGSQPQVINGTDSPIWARESELEATGGELQRGINHDSISYTHEQEAFCMQI